MCEGVLCVRVAHSCTYLVGDRKQVRLAAKSAPGEAVRCEECGREEGARRGCGERGEHGDLPAEETAEKNKQNL